MKRFHVHVTVEDVPDAIPFYAALFGTEPSVVKGDYAKWMLEDPRVNFAISKRGKRNLGLDHLGIQVESEAELEGVAARLAKAGAVTRDQRGAVCCYAKSEKTWVHDPQGIAWETFWTHGEATSYGEDRRAAANAVKGEACCGPAQAA